MKKTNLSGIAASFTAFSILFAFYACAGTAETMSDTGEDKAAPVETAAAEETQIQADVPPMNYDGYTFTFMHYESDTGNSLQNKDLFAENINGDVLNDAVFERNSAVEQEFNIKIALQLEMWNTMPGK